MNQPNFNRRDFLNSSVSAGVAAGLAQGGFFSSSVQASENRKLGVALVGLGSLSTSQIAPAFQKSANCQLAAIVTGTPEKEKSWSEKYGIGRDHLDCPKFLAARQLHALQMMGFVLTSVSDRKFPIRRLASRDHFPAVSGGIRHRFFTQNMLPGLGRANRVFCMHAVWKNDVDQVYRIV